MVVSERNHSGESAVRAVGARADPPFFIGVCQPLRAGGAWEQAPPLESIFSREIRWSLHDRARGPTGLCTHRAGRVRSSCGYFPFVATIEGWSADGLPAQVVMSRSNSVATSGGAPFWR